MKVQHWIILLLAAALTAVSVRLAYEINGEDAVAESAPADGDSDDNAALECIMTRASVRKYTTDNVPDSTIGKLLRAGMAAPTAVDRRPWEFVVVTEQSVKDSIAAQFQWAKMVAESAFCIVVCGNMDEALDGDTSEVGNWVLDCSAATENMLLAAHALGLGGVWCGVYPDSGRQAALARILNLPPELQPLNILSFGRPAGPVTPKDKWNPAKVHYNRFNKQQASTTDNKKITK